MSSNPFPDGSRPFKKIVLAYSGGLDTTVIIPWLRENYPNCHIIAVCADVGQGKETDGLKEKAIGLGAKEFYLEDLREPFITDYVWPTLKAGAVYEGKYLLGTSMARPLIAQRMVEIALREKADAICHGATGKGNDQVRFELSVKALAPQLEIITPWRMWDLQSREDGIAFLEERGIPYTVPKEASYSRDRNSWHLSHEGLELENPLNEPEYERLLQLTVTPEQAPDKPEYVDLQFEEGIPVAINGKTLSPIELLAEINAIGGRNGVGVLDMIENRVVGMKSRGVYETPGGTILYAAHAQLEQLCLDKQTLSFKLTVAQRFAELVYLGEWFTPLRESFSAFIDKTQAVVTGRVRLKLYKGNVTPAGVESPYSLYDESLASFTTGELYNHKDADGFIKLIGLPMRMRALLMQQRERQEANV